MRTSISTTSGSSAWALLDRLEPVRRLADDLELRLGAEDHPEARANEPLVVREQDADHQRQRARGRVKPPSGRGPLSSGAAVDGDALAHPEQPVAAAVAVRAAGAVVDHLDVDVRPSP